MEVHVNLWAVLLAMISSLAIGSLWYAQKVFGKTWVKLAHVDMSKTGNGAKPIIATAIVSLVTAYVLAHVTYLSFVFFQNSFLYSAFTTAFWVWLGFTAARVITHDMFEGRPFKLTLITISHEFVTIMVMALIIGLFGGPVES